MKKYHIIDENYINIQGWMITKLNLSSNELLCYALIYGFSQDGESSFQGSSAYISEWLNVSKPTVLSVLKKLCEKGLIEKIEKTVNGCHLCDYKIILPMVKKLNSDGKETLPHNNIYNNKKEIYKEKELISAEQNRELFSGRDINKTVEKEYTEEFDRFWALFLRQRRGNKEKAYKAFCKAIKENRTTVESILESVKNYANSIEVERGYAKGCEAWLNDDRFNNVYIESKKEEETGNWWR